MKPNIENNIHRAAHSPSMITTNTQLMIAKEEESNQLPSASRIDEKSHIDVRINKKKKLRIS